MITNKKKPQLLLAEVSNSGHSVSRTQHQRILRLKAAVIFWGLKFPNADSQKR